MNRKAILFVNALLICGLCCISISAQRSTQSGAAPTASAQPIEASQTSTRKDASQASIESADIVITATVTAKELLFEIVPNPTVEFPGRHKRDTIWEAERENLPRPVEPGITYRNIGIRLKIVSRFADIERIVAEALGEIPVTDEVQPPEKKMPQTNTLPPPTSVLPNGGSQP